MKQRAKLTLVVALAAGLVLAGGILYMISGGEDLTLWRPTGSMIRAGDWIGRAYVTPVSRRGRQSGFRLRLYSVADLSQRRDVLFSELEDDSRLGQNAKVIGSDGRHLWLYGSTLYGVDLRSLEVIRIEHLNQANPGMEGAWMAESKYGQLDRASGRLELTAADGRKFLIEPGTLKATAKQDGGGGPSRDAADYQRKQEAYEDAMAIWDSFSLTSFYFAGELRSDAEWVGLMSEQEATEPQNYWRMPRQLYRNELRRRLYRVRLETTYDERGVRTRKRVGVEPLGQDSYLRAGLVREANAAKAWRLQDPDGYLLLHQYRLDGPIVAARLDLTGKKVWEWNLGTQQIRMLFPGGNHLGLEMENMQLGSLDLKSGTLKTIKMP